MNYLGVPLFFSLSSFLITYRLLYEKKSSDHIQLLRFYRNRILRIWPAYYIVIILCFVLLPLGASVLHAGAPTLPPVLPFIFFYVNFHIIEHGELFTFALAILWSISVEEQFYLVWGILVKWINTRFTWIPIAALFIFSIVFSYYYLRQHSFNNLAIHSFFILQNFCTGALAALIAIRKRGFSLPVNISRMFFAAAYVILPTCYLFSGDLILLNSIKSICYAIIIYDQSINNKPLFNAGRSAVINYLGKISYGLYLYHAIIIVVLQYQFSFFGGAAHYSFALNIIHSLTALLITIIVSHISYKYIESRFLAMKAH